VDRLLGEYRLPKDGAAGRQQLEAAVEARRALEEGDEFKAVRRGWCLGDEPFRKELLAQMGKTLGAEHYGEERAETSLENAERIIAAEQKRRSWTEACLREMRKGDGGKVMIAERLRAETMQSVGWIADRLYLGSRAYAHDLLWQARSRARRRQFLRPYKAGKMPLTRPAAT